MKTIARRRQRTGQSLVEFALVLIPFMFLLLGVVDLGRGIAANNGVAQAAREIARATSSHPGVPLGSSAETAAVISTQRGTVLGLSNAGSTITFTCTDIADNAYATTDCARGKYVRVEVRVGFSVLTPLLSMVAPKTLTSTSHIEIE